MNESPATLMAKAHDWWEGAKANPLFLRGLIGSIAIIAADQASKAWVVYGINLPARRQIDLSSIFDLTYVQNYGASFGMLAGGLLSRALLSLVSLGVATGLVIWLGQLNRKWAATGVSLIVGGAIGNLYDRVRLGYVVDFLDFSGLYFPWVFNVADVAINIGIAFLILDAFLEHRAEKAS